MAILSLELRINIHVKILLFMTFIYERENKFEKISKKGGCGIIEYIAYKNPINPRFSKSLTEESEVPPF